MNTIKKMVIILVLSFIQNELSAQVNSNTSVQLVDVKTLSSTAQVDAKSKGLILDTQTFPIDPNFILIKDSVLSKETIPHDPKLMELKPE